MPEFWANDQLGEPEFKLWMRGATGGGRGGQRPGGGGGFATFGGGLNTLGGGSSLGTPGFMRRTPFESAALGYGTTGPSPWLRAPGLGANGSTDMSTASSGLTPEEEAQIARLPNIGGLRDTMRRQLLKQKQAQAASAASGAGDPYGNLNWGELQRLIFSGFGRAGAFDPMGNPAILDEISRRGQQAAASAENRARLSSRLSGLDPAAAASYAMEAGLRGQSDTAQAVSNALLEQLMAQDAFGKSVMMGFINPNQGAFSQNWVQQQQPRPNQWAQLLGGLGGSVAGSWLSPGGIWGRSRQAGVN